MTVDLFLMLLAAFSLVTSAVVELMKTLSYKKLKSYNLIAVITGMIVGVFGLYSYNVLTDFVGCQPIIYILMGFATAGTSMLGYDKVKQMIEQFRK